MECYVGNEIQNSPVGGNSCESTSCIATLTGLLLERSMKKIMLANNKGKALIDDKDYDLVSKVKWQRDQAKHTAYAISSVKIDGKYKTVRMHRLIMSASKGQDVDHINHNGLDNRRSNLRLCTRSQNRANSNKISGCSCGYKGVSFSKEFQQWRVEIMKDGISHYVGLYGDDSAAAIAYNRKALELYGEFASLNVILEPK